MLTGLGKKARPGKARRFCLPNNGVGDIRVTAKYKMLASLRSMLVMGFGVDIPTGDTSARDSSGGVMEAPS